MHIPCTDGGKEGNSTYIRVPTHEIKQHCVRYFDIIRIFIHISIGFIFEYSYLHTFELQAKFPV